MTASLRAELLLCLAEVDARPTYEELQNRLGLPNKQAVNKHIFVLSHQGLVQRGGQAGALRLTPLGRMVADYVSAAVAGETLWRYYVKRFFLVYSRSATQAVEAAAAASDRLYPPHRRVTSLAIVHALKTSRQLEEAACSRHLEQPITVGALHQRVIRLFAAARKEFDCRAPHEQAETTEELRRPGLA